MVVLHQDWLVLSSPRDPGILASLGLCKSSFIILDYSVAIGLICTSLSKCELASFHYPFCGCQVQTPLDIKFLKLSQVSLVQQDLVGVFLKVSPNLFGRV